MDGAEGLALLLSSSLCLCFILKFLGKLWWTPMRIQRRLRGQEIQGPSYKFLHGNTKEIYRLRKDATSKPMEISHNIFPRIQPHIHAWINTYGRNYLQWHGTQPQLVVTEMEMIREIVSNKNGLFPKPKTRDYTRKLLGDGLVTVVDEKKWIKLRTVANQAFHGESLKLMFPVMVASTKEMLRRWEGCKGKEIEVFDEFRLLTSEVISRTAFGSSYLDGQNIFDMLIKLAALAARASFKVKIPIISQLLNDGDETEAEKLEKGIRDLVIKVIRSREQMGVGGEAAQAGGYGEDFLGRLVKSHHDPDKSKRITLDDVVDECKTFYMAGHETTNNALAWAMLLLATHEDWQERARKEVIQTLGQDEPSSEGVTRLKTLTMIIKETLRLYPPVVALQRNTGREVKLGDLVVPANTNIYISTLALHHDPKIWGEDVLLFKPERFAEGVSKATNNNVTGFVPFGLGPRTCVGANYAITEVKIVLAMILQRYKVTLSASYVHSPHVVITIKPQHGVQLILQSV
uniref:Cytochrome P450 n=1 Tax=Kalanchoe fedtschenkoi TaxID=63787 RepID=A0A7N0ZS13_KALFE